MLKFFRKNQRVFFIFVAFFIIVTFSFFGTQKVAGSSTFSKKKDKQIATSINGKKINLSDVELMSYFLTTDAEDINSSNQSSFAINLLNDGVIKNDFLRSDLAKVFIQNYFDVFKPFLEKNHEKIKRYVPFRHFYDSNISIKNIWDKFNPKISEKLEVLKKETLINENYLSLLIDLYVEQSKVPAELARRMMVYQERHTQNIQPDIRLYQDDLNMFGFKNTFEWFSKDFVDLISQFIINVASLAEEKGYSVTKQEALDDLINNLNVSLKQLNITGATNDYFSKQLQSLGLNEKNAVDIWQKVLLFRKYYKDVSDNVLMDNLAQKDFNLFSSKEANIIHFSLKDSLQINNLDDLMKLEMYLLATTDKKNPLDLPNEFLKTEEIEKNYPELIEKRYSIKLKHTNLQKAALKIKVQDMYSWQLEDANWMKLKDKFFFISNAITKEEKLKILDKLDFAKKDQVDSFSRLEMLKDKKELIDTSLAEATENELDLNINLKNPKLPLNSLKNPDEFVELISTNDSIEKYTQDNENFYSVVVMKRDSEKYLISFERARKEKIIDDSLNNYLKSKYEDFKITHADKFKNSQGEFLSFDNAKTKVFSLAFQDVFDEIKSKCNIKSSNLNDLAKYRLFSYVNDLKNNIQNDLNYLSNINDQWRLIKEAKTIQRSKEQSDLQKIAFSLKENSFSNIELKNNANIEFVYLKDFQDAKIMEDEVNQAKKAISLEMHEIITKKLLKQIMNNNSIVLPIKETKKDV
ncbi:MAG: hypothetical protein JXA94_01215 [Parachlamydiales bacterium]|nr:hypothetical protein [Parachlamydiales bacterium]